MTTPDPRALRPMVTMDGPAAVGDGGDRRTDLFDSAHDVGLLLVPLGVGVVTCDLQVTTDKTA